MHRRWEAGAGDFACEFIFVDGTLLLEEHHTKWKITTAS